MAKRRLSQQQKARIQQGQAQRLRNAQKTQSWDDDSTLGPEQHGMVTARYSRHVDIAPQHEDGSLGENRRCHVRANVTSITVGDEIVWRETAQGDAVVVAVAQRRSLIERPDSYGKMKAVAANIDQIFIVFAAEPEPHPNLIDRYLIAAENAGITACLVFNKVDLATAGAFAELLDTYRALKYPVFPVSAETHSGLEALRQALAGKTSVFVGQSGVGKSSIINALLPELGLKTGTLSDHVTKGRHTTTTSGLYALPEGGYLIDSPGIREFHLSHFEPAEIYAGYRELQPLLGQCQFRDCQHDQEPGCAIKDYLNSGKMAATRMQSLHYIINGPD